MCSLGGECMTVKEVAEKENVHVQTVRQWIKLNKLKAKATATGYVISENQYLAFQNIRNFERLKRRDNNV